MKADDKTLLAQELARTIGQFKRLGSHGVMQKEIRPSEFFLLANLVHSEGLSSNGTKISDLSTRMQITPGAVTHMINSLEEGGYVERLPSANDRRVVLIKATDEGKKIVDRMEAECLEDLKGLMGFLGEEDSKNLIRILSQVLTYYKEKPMHRD